jgi:hypothetical protein
MSKPSTLSLCHSQPRHSVASYLLVHPATFRCAAKEPPPYPHSMRRLQVTFLALPIRAIPAQAPSPADTGVQFSGTMIGVSGCETTAAIRSSKSIQPGLAASACIQSIRSGILTAFAGSAFT